MVTGPAAQHPAAQDPAIKDIIRVFEEVWRLYPELCIKFPYMVLSLHKHGEIVEDISLHVRGVIAPFGINWFWDEAQRRMFERGLVDLERRKVDADNPKTVQVFIELIEEWKAGRAL